MTIDLERLAWILGSGAVIVLLVGAAWRLVTFGARRLAHAALILMAYLAIGALRLLGSFGLRYLGGPGPVTLGAPAIDLAAVVEALRALASGRDQPAEAPRPVDVPLKGRIAFDVPDRMRQGEAITAVVRITRDMGLEFRRLAAGLEPETTGIREIDVAYKMRVALRPENEGDFTVTSLSSPEQALAASGYTHWQFRVRAERRGPRKLILGATMLWPDALDLEPWEHEIEVDVTPGYGALRLVRTYPGTVLSVMALPFAGLLFEVSGAKDATQDLVEPRVRAWVGLPPKEEKAAPGAAPTQPAQEASPTERDGR